MIVDSSCGEQLPRGLHLLWCGASEAETLILTEFQLLKVEANTAIEREDYSCGVTTRRDSSDKETQRLDLSLKLSKMALKKPQS